MPRLRDRQLSEDRFFVFSRRATIAVFVPIVAILVIDLLASRQAILRFDDTLETLYLALTTTIAWGVGSWLIFGFIGRLTADIRARSLPLRLLHILVMITQFALLVVLLYVISDRMSEILTQFVYAVSSILAVAILFAFSIKFFSWYNLDRAGNRKNFKEHLTLLFFALAAAGFTLSIGTDYFSKAFLIQTMHENTPPGAEVGEKFPFRDVEQGRIIAQDTGPETTITYMVPSVHVETYHLLGLIPPYFSFFFRWAATSVTTRDYYRLMGTITFWALISIPLILYGIGKIPDLFDAPDELWQRIIYRTGSIGGNIIFGLAFFVMASKVNPPVKDYLINAGMGITIIGIAFGISGVQQTFGIAGHSMVLISAYMFAIGMYATATSVSHDQKLRQSIRKSVSNELKLVGKIGDAQMEQEVQKKSLTIAKANSRMMVEQSGIRSSLEDEDMEQYVKQVMVEIRKQSSRPSFGEAA